MESPITWASTRSNVDDGSLVTVPARFGNTTAWPDGVAVSIGDGVTRGSGNGDGCCTRVPGVSNGRLGAAGGAGMPTGGRPTCPLACPVPACPAALGGVTEGSGIAPWLRVTTGERWSPLAAGPGRWPLPACAGLAPRTGGGPWCAPPGLAPEGLAPEGLVPEGLVPVGGGEV